jgi:signal peptidase II
LSITNATIKTRNRGADGMLVKYKWQFLSIATAFLVFLDWMTKYVAVTSLYGHPPLRIVGRFLQLMVIYNKAALFGIDPRHFLPFFPLTTFFFIFSIIAIAVIVVYYKSLRGADTLMHWGLSMILPGALGNLLDRVLHPHLGVVDFIRVGISDTVYWPIFNLADAYVTIGVALIFISFIREDRSRKSTLPASKPSGNEAETLSSNLSSSDG